MKKRLLQVTTVLYIFLFVYTAANATGVVRTEYNLKSEKLTHPYKILLISDIHYGCVQDKGVVDRALEQIAKEDADVMILAGDIVQSSMTSKEDMREIFDKLGSIPVKDGKYFVYGNHDLREEQNYDTWDLLSALFSNDIWSLNDEHMHPDKEVTIIGRRNALSKDETRANITGLIHRADTYTICVDHTPTDVVECATAGVDLQLSGHTHGGQLFPLNLYVMCKWHMPVYGHLEVGRMNLVVTSGMGVSSYNARNLHHCEYVVINIEPKQENERWPNLGLQDLHE